MKFIADTNIISELTKERRDPAVVSWLREHGDQVGICWITVAELRAGIAIMPEGKRRAALEAVVDGFVADFYQEDALELRGSTAAAFARLQEDRRDAGESQDWPDAVIAAVAQDHGMTVATRNTDHFPGVSVVNPWNEKAPGDRSQGAV